MDDPSGLSGDDIELWTVDLDDWASDTDRLHLSPADRDAVDNLRDPVAAQRLAARRLASRQIVARSLGLRSEAIVIRRRCRRCGSDDHGRPYVDGWPISFSISASSNRCAVAVSRHEVGLDLEVVSDDVATQWKALTGPERAAVDALPVDRQVEAFLRLWTAKESVLKAEGLGLGADPATIDTGHILETGEGTVRGHGRGWEVRLFFDAFDGQGTAVPNESAVLALADEARAPVVRRTLEP
jgi:phosphopantetheinyl transferase